MARRTLFVVAIVVGSLLVLSTAALAALRFAHHGEVLPGVSLDGVRIGGLDDEAARATLADVVAARESDTVTLTFAGRQFILEPETVGFRIDLDASLDEAFGAGRGAGFVDESVAHLRSLWEERDLELTERIDEDQLDAWVVELAATIDRRPDPGAITADPDSLEVTTTLPQGGATVRQDETVALVRQALSDPGPETLELPADTTPARIEDAEVEAVATLARRALEEPLVLRASGASVTLDPADIAPLLALRERQEGGDWTVELYTPLDRVETAFTDVAGRFEVDPVEASFDVPRTPPTTLDVKGDTSFSPVVAEVGVIPSANGATFDPELAATQLTELLTDGVREAELRLEVLEPQLTTAEARGYGITHLLGTFTTYHACCAARVENIQRLADMVDGTTVAPGEQFSINQISGERTCQKGFELAGMILNGEIVDVCGGGVSQFGTTTFNAAYFAGLQLDAWKAHSFYISRYPMGREATLNYPSPDIDVRFTNDTGHGLLVKTSHTGTSITVSIYGQSEVVEVASTTGEPYRFRDYSTEYRENNSLPRGSRRVVQSGQGGFSVQVVRTVRFADGTERRREIDTVYVPEKMIIERNT